MTSTDRRTAAERPAAGAGRVFPVALVALFIVTGLVLAAVGVVRLPNLAQLLHRNSEVTAELSFTQPNALPKIYRPGQKLSFDWRLTNGTALPREYAYTVLVGAGADSTETESGTLPVAAHGRATHTSVIVMPASGGSALVTVKLTDPATTIFFHVVDSSQATRGTSAPAMKGQSASASPAAG